MTIFNKLKSLFANNEKVVENYVFMTAMQIISSAFGILIYPYLIRVLGIEPYGSFVFAIAIIAYFTEFVSFGFHYPSLKVASLNKNNKSILSQTFSAALTGKLLLFLISTVIFTILIFLVPYLNDNKMLFILVFAQILSEIFYPMWYFQAIQKMRIVTYIQLFFRVASLPFIFFMVTTADDLILYAIIHTSTILLSTAALFYVVVVVDKIKIRFIGINGLKTYFKDAQPFFWSDAATTLKQQSVTVIIGSFFGMNDVALYDLANKIITIPRMLTQSINMAIFPKTIENTQTNVVKKIIRFEFILGILIFLLIAVSGYWLILLLGGENMIEALPYLIILSITIISWLTVDSYTNFVFIPQKKYYYITLNKALSIISFLALALPLTLIFKNSLFIIISLTLSTVFEMIYCNYLIKKQKLL
ncbi:MAG: oligosaccharide flippase family protein [Paludibacter sp.]|nr:oligosaccharide flippase family protein [Paludibacter sp.]